jgi:hypothetical protein
MAALALMLGLAMTGLAVQRVAAQEGDAAYGVDVWKSVANCKDCHGWAGDGQPFNPQSPPGANLRETALDAANLADTIRCGRPGSEMPYFGASRAWTTRYPCYGMTAAEIGDQIPVRGDTGLNDRQINALVAMILTNFVGKGPPTFEECEAFFGVGQTRCAGYPKAAAP